MQNWRRAEPLDAITRIEAREGHLFEYVPGRTVATDLIVTPGLRARLLAPFMRGNSVVCTLSALWVHTGYWPPDCLPTLTIAHPNQSAYPVRLRTRIGARYRTAIGGVPVTTPERTAIDLLRYEELSLAVTGVLYLLRAGLRLDALKHCAHLVLRGYRYESARAFIAALPDYLRRREAAAQATSRDLNPR